MPINIKNPQLVIRIFFTLLNSVKKTRYIEMQIISAKPKFCLKNKVKATATPVNK